MTNNGIAISHIHQMHPIWYILYTHMICLQHGWKSHLLRTKSECCFCLKSELISTEFLFIVRTTQKTWELGNKYEYLCQGSAEQSIVGSTKKKKKKKSSFLLSPTGIIKRTAETWLLLAVYSMLSWKQIKQQKTQQHQQKQSQDNISVFMCIVLCFIVWGWGRSGWGGGGGR